MNKDITVKLVRYNFNTRNSEEAKQWKALKAKLNKQINSRCFEVIPSNGAWKGFPEGEYTIETDCLFSDQWNTACGKRVHEWFLEYNVHNLALKKGYYLEETEDLMELLSRSYKCQWSGKTVTIEPGENTPLFNSDYKTLGGEYLEEKDLDLLLYKNLKTGEVAKPSTEEMEFLKELYNKAQKECSEVREKAKLDREMESIERNIKNLQIKLDLTQELISLGLKSYHLDNMILYDHKKAFCFGWRKLIKEEELNFLRDVFEKVTSLDREHYRAYAKCELGGERDLI